MKKHNPRELMEMAIETMRQSIAEPRPDNKACPKVGAVLVKTDGSIVTACRGELRFGDHAEYTLLERKSRSDKLDGSVLYATLEPCAPGARKHPKLGCAERIVLARIKEVWVGIEDPDPTVARKGIKYLRDAGIEVRMFDPDLQEIIRDENRQFLDQALERAASVEEKPKKMILSPLEHPFTGEAISDLSEDALSAFQSSDGINAAVSSGVFNRTLARLGLLKETPEGTIPTGFGLLLFGKEPRRSMPQAGLLGTIKYEGGTHEIRDFDGPQVLVPEQALEWIRDKLPNPIDRSEARRQEADSAFYELVREGIVNAIVHRDYGIKGAKCHIVATADSVVIKSPGKPVDPITIEQMRNFTAPMLSRNPILHYVFSRMGLAEERGLGLTSMRQRAGEVGLPAPKYSWNYPYLELTLYRSVTGATNALPAEVQNALSESERRGWEWLVTVHRAKSSEYASELHIEERSARNHLKRFMEFGLIKRVGQGPSTHYEVI